MPNFRWVPGNIRICACTPRIVAYSDSGKSTTWRGLNEFKNLRHNVIDLLVYDILDGIPTVGLGRLSSAITQHGERTLSSPKPPLDPLESTFQPRKTFSSKQLDAIRRLGTLASSPIRATVTLPYSRSRKLVMPPAYQER